MLTAQSCAIGRQVPENDSLEIMHNITTRPPTLTIVFWAPSHAPLHQNVEIQK